LEELLQQFKQNKKELNLPIQENLARSMAKRCCLKKNTALSNEEMKSIIDQLFACENPNYSPDGEKIISIWNRENLNELFD
jgi:DNA mismatch repair protein MutL